MATGGKKKKGGALGVRVAGAGSTGGPAGERSDIAQLKKDIEMEQKSKDTIEWSNVELERSVRAMERNVLQLEAGNMEQDDSEGKIKFENQRQLNIQLQEQKRWLEHELEQVKLKIQNDKIHPMPDPFSLDWDQLSETEMKRLVGQLEKTRNDLLSDLREMEWRLDKEGREYHHFDDFCQMYRAEIKNLNRTLEALVRNGAIPNGLAVPLSSSSQLGQYGSYPSTGGQTPATGSGTGGPAGGAIRKNSSVSPPLVRRRPVEQLSPTRRKPSDQGSPTRRRPSEQGSPTRRRAIEHTSPTRRRPNAENASPTRRRPNSIPAGQSSGAGNARTGPVLDPKMGPVRKGATVRNLPKIERDSEQRKISGPNGEVSVGALSPQKASPNKVLPSVGSSLRKSAGSAGINELDTVAEAPSDQEHP